MCTYWIWTDVNTSTYSLDSNAETISANFSSSSIHVQTSTTHSFDNNCFLAGEGTMTLWDFFDKNEATYPLICELLNHSSFLNSPSPFSSVTFFSSSDKETLSGRLPVLSHSSQVVLYSLGEPCDLFSVFQCPSSSVFCWLLLVSNINCFRNDCLYQRIMRLSDIFALFSIKICCCIHTRSCICEIGMVAEGYMFFKVVAFRKHLLAGWIRARVEPKI